MSAPAAMADQGGQYQYQQQQQYSSCSSVVSNPLLSGLNDLASYAPLQGGTFEDGGAGWSYNNASVVSGNEPWNVVNAADSQSLNIGSGGSATSPSFCVDNSFPSFRFFAADNSPGGKLVVTARWSTSSGQSGTQYVTSLYSNNYSSWQLTPPIPLGSQVPAGMSVNVQLVFTASSGSWSVDDVLLDPYAK